MQNKITELKNDIQMNDLSEVATNILQRSIQSLEDTFRDHVDYITRWANVAETQYMLGGIHNRYSLARLKGVENRENL